jgi:hypothetical protein
MSPGSAADVNVAVVVAVVVLAGLRRLHPSFTLLRLAQRLRGFWVFFEVRQRHDEVLRCTKKTRQESAAWSRIIAYFSTGTVALALQRAVMPRAISDEKRLAPSYAR